MTPAELLPALPWLAPFAGLARLARNRPNLSLVAPVRPPSGDLVIGDRTRPERGGE